MSDGKSSIKITFLNNHNVTNLSNICRTICIEKIISINNIYGAQLILLGKIISYEKDIQLSLVNFGIS